MVVASDPPIRAFKESLELRFSPMLKESEPVDVHATVKGCDVHKPKHGM
jgi:hypothetical protein